VICSVIFTLAIIMLVILRLVNGPMNIWMPGLGLIVSWNFVVHSVIVLDTLGFGFARILRSRLRSVAR
jgi:hypothetical protein